MAGGGVGDSGFDEHGFAPEVGVPGGDVGAAVLWIHGNKIIIQAIIN